MESTEFVLFSALSVLLFGTVLSEYPACDTGWTEYSSFCYKTFSTTSGYDAAESTCVGNGGHLVSIHSAEEDDFVKTQQESENSGSSLWIGLQLISSELVWTDGTELDYSNMVANSQIYQGNCIVKYPTWQQYQWVPNNCPSSYGYMCKKAGVYAQWNEWSAWSECNCGSNTRLRERVCRYDNQELSVDKCEGSEQETASCTCKPDGHALFWLFLEERHLSEQAGWETAARQSIECGRFCASQAKCVLFQYNHVTGSCQLFDHVISPADPSISSSTDSSIWLLVNR